MYSSLAPSTKSKNSLIPVPNRDDTPTDYKENISQSLQPALIHQTLILRYALSL